MIPIQNFSFFPLIFNNSISIISMIGEIKILSDLIRPNGWYHVGKNDWKEDSMYNIFNILFSIFINEKEDCVSL